MISGQQDLRHFSPRSSGIEIWTDIHPGAIPTWCHQPVAVATTKTATEVTAANTSDAAVEDAEEEELAGTVPAIANPPTGDLLRELEGIPCSIASH
jgi:hypothetical protein